MQLFPDKIFSLIIPIFIKIPDISLTAVKFQDFQVFQTSGHPEYYNKASIWHALIISINFTSFSYKNSSCTNSGKPVPHKLKN